MGKKEIYIVRHGQTDYNKIGKSQGRGVNSSLNDTGKAQAKAFYDAYRIEGFQKLYVSSLIRTHESMEGFIKDQIPYEQLSGLDEISFGVREGKFFVEDGFDHYDMITSKWRNGELDFKFDQGESPLDVMARQKGAMSYILDQPEDKILICMHGRAMRILMAWVFDHELTDMDVFKHDNLGLYVINYADNKFSMVRKNDTSHLNEIAEQR